MKKIGNYISQFLQDLKKEKPEEAEIPLEAEEKAHKEVKDLKLNSQESSHQFWAYCLDQLIKELPAVQFNTWIKPLRCEIRKETLYLIAPNRSIMQWSRKSYTTRIEGIAEEFFSGSIPIAWEIDKTCQETLQEIEKLPMISKEQIVAIEPKRDQTNLVHLPQCPDGKGAMPNVMLRSALFAAIQGGKRRMMLDELIVAVNGVEIRFRGEQLDQTDLDVWQHAITLMKGQAFGSKCCFRGYSFLKALGRQLGGDEYEWLNTTFRRLTGAVVDIRVGDISYFGSLVEGGLQNHATKEYEIRLNPDLSKIFDAGWTQVAFMDRQKLKRKPLAQWLYGMYFSHVKPYPMKVKTIRELSGSNSKDLSKFRQLLRNALDALKAIGFLKSWEIKDDDLVHVEKCELTNSQRKHVEKKKRAKTNK